MTRYKDINGDSGVSEYESGPDFIRVRFEKGGTYLWTAASAGSTHIRNMQQLAQRGDGLNAYINRYVRNSFARRER